MHLYFCVVPYHLSMELSQVPLRRHRPNGDAEATSRVGLHQSNEPEMSPKLGLRLAVVQFSALAQICRWV
jgi:hypothetical protein